MKISFKGEKKVIEITYPKVNQKINRAGRGNPALGEKVRLQTSVT